MTSPGQASGNGGRVLQLNDLGMVDPRQHQRRRSQSRAGMPHSKPIDIPPQKERSSQLEWSGSHEVAQQSMNDMNMRMSRSRDRRTSLTDMSEANHSAFGGNNSCGGHGGAPPPTDRAGRSISHATPDGAVHHHLDLQHEQQQMEMMTPSGESAYGSGFGGSVYGGSPRTMFSPHASLYSSSAHHHHHHADSLLSDGGGGGGGGAQRRHSGYYTYAVGSHDHHHNYASSPNRFSALAASAAADDAADDAAAAAAAAQASASARGFHVGGGGVGFARGLVYEEDEQVQTGVGGRGVVNGDDSDDDGTGAPGNNDDDDLADGVFNMELSEGGGICDL